MDFHLNLKSTTKLYPLKKVTTTATITYQRLRVVINIKNCNHQMDYEYKTDYTHFP